MGHALQGKSKVCPEKSQDGLLPDNEHNLVTQSNSNTEASQKPHTQHEIVFIKLKIELNDTLLGIHVHVVNCMRKGEEDGYRWGRWGLRRERQGGTGEKHTLVTFCFLT